MINAIIILMATTLPQSKSNSNFNEEYKLRRGYYMHLSSGLIPNSNTHPSDNEQYV